MRALGINYDGLPDRLVTIKLPEIVVLGPWGLILYFVIGLHCRCRFARKPLSHAPCG